ncbi:ABC transporter permease [Pseudonocardia pini]|uniref:ABC transporter permease n=1 Tax=Pseudonocardia pini TaxID=2758030 RepID=UPI0015F05B92|nr:ABC transporter permease [Pseudonocardia pini]
MKGEVPVTVQDTSGTEPAEKVTSGRGAGAGGLGGYSSDRSLLADAGEIGRFLPKALLAVPMALRYPVDVLRQIGILITSSAAIIIFMELLIAAEISLEGHYVLSQLGATSYVGLFSVVTDYTVQAVMWGWILGAKVGCGLVAELGSMRINDEIDALEVMGVDSKAYLVGTRILALMIVTPFLFVLATGIMYITNYVVNVHVFQSVSPGGFIGVHFSFLTRMDIILSMVEAFVISVLIGVTACYYGYNAKGGSVGVGQNTARSEIIALVITGVVGVIGAQLFFTGFERGPIAQ